MYSKSLIFTLILMISALQSTAYAQLGFTWQDKRPSTWNYDPGPSLETQKDFINHHSDIPSFAAISKRIMRNGKQKFRPAYGAIPWRA